MVGGHHQLDGHEVEQNPEDSKGQGGLACCSPWSRKESDGTERLNSNNCLLITEGIAYLKSVFESPLHCVSEPLASSPPLPHRRLPCRTGASPSVCQRWCSCEGLFLSSLPVNQPCQVAPLRIPFSKERIRSSERLSDSSRAAPQVHSRAPTSGACLPYSQAAVLAQVHPPPPH